MWENCCSVISRFISPPVQRQPSQSICKVFSKAVAHRNRRHLIHCIIQQTSIGINQHIRGLHIRFYDNFPSCCFCPCFRSRSHFFSSFFFSCFSIFFLIFLSIFSTNSSTCPEVSSAAAVTGTANIVANAADAKMRLIFLVFFFAFFFSP